MLFPHTCAPLHLTPPPLRLFIYSTGVFTEGSQVLFSLSKLRVKGIIRHIWRVFKL